MNSVTFFASKLPQNSCGFAANVLLNLQGEGRVCTDHCKRGFLSTLFYYTDDLIRLSVQVKDFCGDLGHRRIKMRGRRLKMIDLHTVEILFDLHRRKQRFKDK